MWLVWQLSAGNPSAALLMAALAHDAGERKTGDMPSPTKRALGVGELMDKMERAHVGPTGLFHSEVWEPLSLIEQQILKLADNFEGAFFCLRELLLGNRLVLDPAWNGAALNYLVYIEELLGRVEAPEVKALGTELLNYLKEQFYEHSPRPR